MSKVTNVKMNKSFKKMFHIPKGWPSPNKMSKTNPIKKKKK